MFRPKVSSTVPATEHKAVPARVFYLKTSPRDVETALLAANNICKNKKDATLKAVNAFCGKIKNKSHPRLSIEEYYELTRILLADKSKDPEIMVLKNLIRADLLDHLKQIPAKSLSLDTFKRVCRIYPCVYPLPIAPPQIEEKDLTDTGHLVVKHRDFIKALVKEKIKAMVAEGVKPEDIKGRVTKAEIFQRLKDAGIQNPEYPTCGAEFQMNSNGVLEIYWYYKGDSKTKTDKNPLGNLIGKGAFGKVKAMEIDSDEKTEQKNENWHTLKIEHIKETKQESKSTKNDEVDLEHKLTAEKNLAKGLVVRTSSKGVKQKEMIMRWLSGDSLRNLIRVKGMSPQNTPLAILLEFMLNILKSTQAFHKLNYIHRDISPKNIMVSDNDARVIDFGLAITSPRLKKNRQYAGTPGYIHPDISQIGSSIKTDIYSLGIVFAEMLGLLNKDSEHIPEFGYALAEVGSRQFFEAKVPIEILNFLNKMIRLDPKKQPEDLDECINFVSEQLEAQLKSSSIKTAVVDLNEFINSSPEAQEKIMAQLENIPRLQFVERGPRRFTTKQAILAHRKLSQFCFVAKDIINIENDLTCLPDTLKLVLDKKYHFHFLSNVILKEPEVKAFKNNAVAYEMPLKAPASKAGGFKYAGILEMPSFSELEKEEEDEIDLALEPLSLSR